MNPIEPKGDVLYEDNFADLANWCVEGLVTGVTIIDGALRLDCTGSRQGGVGCMAFCRRDFPDRIAVDYDGIAGGFAVRFSTSPGSGAYTDSREAIPTRWFLEWI